MVKHDIILDILGVQVVLRDMGLDMGTRERFHDPEPCALKHPVDQTRKG